jgi:hypothetical protein
MLVDPFGKIGLARHFLTASVSEPDPRTGTSRLCQVFALLLHHVANGCFYVMDLPQVSGAAMTGPRLDSIGNQSAFP